jgi:hypothetical protein
MDTISNIRRQIFKAPKDHIFTTREFLAFGMRAAVDQALYRLVKRGLLKRIARGVFIKDGSPDPSIEQIAKIKARAFGKTIIKHCGIIAHELKVLTMDNPEAAFATSGRSTSFRVGSLKVNFKQISPRKMKLGDRTCGQALRALWYLGKNLCQPETIMKATRYFTRLDRQQVKVLAPFMPAWLTDNLGCYWPLLF